MLTQDDAYRVCLSQRLEKLYVLAYRDFRMSCSTAFPALAVPISVFARLELVRQSDVPSKESYRLLLEGSWPETEGNRNNGASGALDELIDGRFAWIDRQSLQLVARVADRASLAAVRCCRRTGDLAPSPLGPFGASSGLPTALLDDLGSLKLRYWFVKMLRVVAFFTRVRPLEGGSYVRLVVDSGRDEDYVALLKSLCAARGAKLEVQRTRSMGLSDTTSERLTRSMAHTAKNGKALGGRQHEPGGGPDLALRAVPSPIRARWQLLRFTNHLARRIAGHRPCGPPIIVCGNPNVLDPVCSELRRRRHRVWWAYEQPAIRSAIRWSLRGVGQLTCTTETLPATSPRAVAAASVPDEAGMQAEGIDLSAALQAWRRTALVPRARRLSRVWQSALGWIDRVRPAAVVVSDDATPMCRALVRAAKVHGVGSLVVQHGAPCVCFGFAPLLADRIAVWGDASYQQLVEWGVEAGRILLAGKTKRQPVARRRRSGQPPRSRPKRVLILDTAPPVDRRPDAVGFHLTWRTYRSMVESVCRALSLWPNLSVVVRPHPRRQGSEVWRAVAASFSNLDLRIVGQQSIDRQLKDADVVISFASSAGIEAASVGKTVIQMLPERSTEILPADRWGLLGTARTATELSWWLKRCFDPRKNRRETESQTPAFVATGREAARRIADGVAELIAARAISTVNNPGIRGFGEARPPSSQQLLAKATSE